MERLTWQEACYSILKPLTDISRPPWSERHEPIRFPPKRTNGMKMNRPGKATVLRERRLVKDSNLLGMKGTYGDHLADLTNTGWCMMVSRCHTRRDVNFTTYAVRTPRFTAYMMRRSIRESVLSRVDVSDSVGSYSPDNSDVLPKASTLRMKIVA